MNDHVALNSGLFSRAIWFLTLSGMVRNDSLKVRLYRRTASSAFYAVHERILGISEDIPMISGAIFFAVSKKVTTSE